MFVNALEMDNLDCNKINAHFNHLFPEGPHSRVEAYIASPTSPPYVGKQLMALFHTLSLVCCVQDIKNAKDGQEHVYHSVHMPLCV